MGNWLQISIALDETLIEPISDYLIGIIGAGVEINAEQHIKLKSINAYWEKKNPALEEVEQVISKIEAYCSELAGIFEVSVPLIEWEMIQDQDWGQSWKEHFSPIAISQDLIIAPSWEDYQPRGNEKLIVMDPGMAFGTGHHATTQLVVKLMDDVIKTQDGINSVLDVGTGTGILGIAAALCGIKRVYGIDNDPVAVRVASENIHKNNLSQIMKVGGEDISEIKDEYSLIVANIVHDILVSMAEEFRRLTALDGRLILSGILEGKQESSLHVTFRKYGFSFLDRKQKDEWVALLFCRER